MLGTSKGWVRLGFHRAIGSQSQFPLRRQKENLAAIHGQLIKENELLNYQGMTTLAEHTPRLKSLTIGAGLPN